MRHAKLTVAGLLMACMVTGCATDLSQRRPYLIRENLDNAKRHLSESRNEEAAQIYQLVLLADPENVEAKSKLMTIPKFDESVIRPSMMGKNLCRRPTSDDVGLLVVMYPVNRVLDLLDVVSFNLGLQGGVLVDVHATHALQVMLGLGGGMQLGWWQGRDLGLGSGNVAGWALGPFNLEGEGFTRLGTRGATSQGYSVVGLSRPSDPVYQRYRDYWGIGGRVIAGVVGAEVEFHPIEVVDALCGFLFIDFLRDDIGRTRSLELNPADMAAMKDLLGTISREELRQNAKIQPTAE